MTAPSLCAHQKLLCIFFSRELAARPKRKLAASGVVQALRLCQHVLHCHELDSVLSQRVIGLADKMAGEHLPQHQARDLTVLEVRRLEEAVQPPDLDTLDIYPARRDVLSDLCQKQVERCGLRREHNL